MDRVLQPKTDHGNAAQDQAEGAQKDMRGPTQERCYFVSLSQFLNTE